MEFKILNSKRFWLPVSDIHGNKLQTPRWEHIATLGWNTREFMVFSDCIGLCVYIEEIVGGHLEKIKDNQLWDSLLSFANLKGFTQITSNKQQ